MDKLTLPKTLLQKMFEIKKRRITLTRNTKAFNYKYATLDQIQDKINPILEEMNLFVTHKVSDGFVTTTVIDIDNENDQISSSIQMGSSIKAQDKGSEITYFRRYNLICLFDLEVEDDDGAKASKDIQETKKTQKQDTKPVFGKEKFNIFKTNREQNSKKYPTSDIFLAMLRENGYSVESDILALIREYYNENTN